MNKNTTMIIAVVLVIAAAIGGFFGGIQYQKMQRGSFISGQFGGTRSGQNGNFQRRFGGGAAGANRPVIGQIVSVSDTGVTIKMMDGSTKIVIVSDSTLINKSDKGTKSDLKTGENVAAFGAANSDGSVTAQNIQLNPQMRMGGASR